eukprot:2694523-Rhodomonas_salina.1
MPREYRTSRSTRVGRQRTAPSFSLMIGMTLLGRATRAFSVPAHARAESCQTTPPESTDRLLASFLDPGNPQPLTQPSTLEAHTWR